MILFMIDNKARVCPMGELSFGPLNNMFKTPSIFLTAYESLCHSGTGVKYQLSQGERHSVSLIMGLSDSDSPVTLLRPSPV